MPPGFWPMWLSVMGVAVSAKCGVDLHIWIRDIRISRRWLRQLENSVPSEDDEQPE